MPELLATQQLCFVLKKDSFQLKVLEKHFQRDDVACNRSRSQLQVAQVAGQNLTDETLPDSESSDSSANRQIDECRDRRPSPCCQQDDISLRR